MLHQEKVVAVLEEAPDNNVKAKELLKIIQDDGEILLITCGFVGKVLSILIIY